MLAVDTETTGVDRQHGAKPFFVTTCNSQGTQLFWEWDVNPLTRQPIVPEEDLDAIGDLLNPHNNKTGASLDGLILHNAKFDVAMLATLRPEFGTDWDWNNTFDTLLAGHLLFSNRPKNLTDMSLMMLGTNIEEHELNLKQACNEARRIARSKFPEWRIAKKGAVDLPSAKEEPWKFDTWLPRAIVKHLWENSEAGKRWNKLEPSWKPQPKGNLFLRILKKDKALEECKKLEGWEYHPPFGVFETESAHPWWTVLSTYANTDSAVTLALWMACREVIKERGLTKIYNLRRQLLPIIYKMEQQGITLSGERFEQLQKEYQEASEKSGRICVNIAQSFNYDLTLPKSGNNNSLLGFCFGKHVASCERCKTSVNLTPEKASKLVGKRLPCLQCKEKGKEGVVTFTSNPGLNLPVVEETDTGNPSLNKVALEQYLATLEEKSKQRLFIKELHGKRSRDTALTYMEGYKRFWVPLEDGFYVLFPSLNPTGTDTLRFSSSNPNEQNISKKENFNLRYMFGPRPGREWWSCDARGIEDRLPAYESQQQELIEIFEKPDAPPYYGSNHLLRFHTVYPDIWDKTLDDLIASGMTREEAEAKVGPTCKKKYASTYYQWCKNGGFAVQYGAIDRSDGNGTADRAFHRKGCHALLKKRFSKLEALNQKCIDFADKYGYVETMPDKSVDPTKGYPLLCARTDYGKVLPTVPLNYHIQGTAMWWMGKAMIRVQAQLDEWNQRGNGKQYFIAMQIHDEMVFDFPKGADPKTNPKQSNLWRVRKLQKLMEMGGDDLGIPTPTSCEYHPDNWAEGITF